MADQSRIIVSMTSYPARIKNVPLSVFALLKKQTLPPDEIHLWLGTPQFPNKEADLPAELVMLAQAGLVQIHWLEKNTYVHKRHEIFKEVNEGCIFLIDDDVVYNQNLIKTVMGVHQQYPNAIVCYNHYDKHQYNGKHILYGNYCPHDGIYTNQYRWCGQSMIPATVYPNEILSVDNQAIRDQTSPVSDECWMQPWIVFHDIPIYFLHFGWGDDIDPATGKNTGIVSWSHQKDKEGYERRDIWLNNVLTSIPALLGKYKELFNYGK